MHKKLRNIKLVVFDLDGVLVDTKSSWQTVHEAFGVDNEENFQRYLRNEISFKEFMRSDIRLWKNIHINQIKGILDQVPLINGAKETIDALRKAGYKTAIVSSGISLLADRIKKELGVDQSFANELLINKNGHITGEGKENVELLKKMQTLQRLAAIEGITTKQCAVVGDSIFDIPLFKKAGFSIAFNTNDRRVKEAADLAIEDKNLKEILQYFI
jgi:phosphoserine phosphatase